MAETEQVEKTEGEEVADEVAEEAESTEEEQE